MNDLNAPLDPWHTEALEIRNWINNAFLEAKIRVAKWAPKLMPENWNPHAG